MSGYDSKNYYVSQRLNPDQYLDMAIKDLISLHRDLLEKDDSFDVTKFRTTKLMLTEQLENIAIGLNKLDAIKKEYVLEELNDNQKELRIALFEYFKKEFPEIKKGYVHKTEAVMRFIIEGAYSTAIKLRTEELDKQVKEGTIDVNVADSQKANLKLQLILNAVQNRKVKSAVINV